MNEAETVSLEVPTAPIPMPPTGQGNEAPPEFSGAPGDLQKDLALLAAQQNPPPVPEPVKAPEPVQPATATATPEVPDKFKTPDGGMDVEKVKKSLAHAEAALLQKALEVEQQLRRKQNEAAALRSGQPVPVAPAAAPVQTQMSPLEVQVAQDLIQAHAEQGLNLAPAQAAAMAKVQVRLAEAKYQADVTLTEQLRQRIEDQDRRRELEAIAKEDSSVFTPEGIEALSKIRMENPWVNQAPNPWQAAYDLHLANQTRTQRLNGQVTPNPKGPAAKAPPTPVGPAPRVSVQPTAPVLQTKEDIDKHLSTLDEKGQEAFFKGFGLKFR